MIGVMIGDQKRFAQDGLPIAMRNFRVQIGFLVRDEFGHGLQIGAKATQAVVPGCRVSRRRALGPIAFGPGRRLMLRIAAEFQNVPLRDAHVLQQLPRAVRRAGWYCPAQPRRKIRHHRVEIGMRVASTQQVHKVLAEVVGVGHHSRKTQAPVRFQRRSFGLCRSFGGFAAAYCKLIVAVVWLLTVPIVSTTGTAPAPAPAGITTCTCTIPETSPGEDPAYVTCAALPPTVAVTGATSVRKTLFSTSPSWPAGSVAPPPVAKIATTLPAVAGLLCEFSVPS